MKKEILRMEHVTVRYAGRNVLEDFHLNIYEGEFLFLYGFPDSGIRELGELLKGNREVQNGRFYICENEVAASAFEEPGRYGIYFVQNEDNLVEDFTVAENLFFGGKKRFFQKVPNKKQQELMAYHFLERFEMEDLIDPSGKVRNISYYDQILLKLMMADVLGAKLVVLDRIMGFDLEKEDNHLLERTLKILLDDGISILWMNQRMDAARYMADRMIIMQKGHNVRTIYKNYEGDLDHQLYDIASQSERSLNKQEPDRNPSANIVFEIGHLSSGLLFDMSLKIHEGEIVSICSSDSFLMQNWRNIVTGMEENYQGTMKLDGMPFRPKSYADCSRQGVGFLDLMWYERHCNLDMSIEDNLLLPTFWHRKGLMGFLRRDEWKYARYLYQNNYPGWPKDDYWWKLTADQQKTLLLEKLCFEPHRMVIITEPFFQLHSSLLDDFYQMIRKVRDNNGAVVLMAAIDMDVRPISDRVVYLDQWSR